MRDMLYEAYVAAKATREAAVAALKQAGRSKSAASVLAKQLVTAERQEFAALAALLAKS